MCLHLDNFSGKCKYTAYHTRIPYDNPKTLPPATALRNGKCFRLGYQFGYRYSMIYHLVLHLHGQLLFASLDVWKYMQILQITLPETNIAPENRCSQKETSIPTIHFRWLC